MISASQTFWLSESSYCRPGSARSTRARCLASSPRRTAYPSAKESTKKRRRATGADDSKTDGLAVQFDNRPVGSRRGFDLLPTSVAARFQRVSNRVAKRESPVCVAHYRAPRQGAGSFHADHLGDNIR